MLKARSNKNATVWLWLALLSVTGFFLLAPLPAMSSDPDSVDAPGFNIDSRWPSPAKSAHDGGGHPMPPRPMRFILKASVDSSGVHGNANSYGPSISADGRYVAFVSRATNLVVGDTNGHLDVFVHDRITGATTLASVDSSGRQSDDDSWLASISADGRCVAFESVATNLVPGDTNRLNDVFVHDRTTGTTSRVSVSSSGAQGYGDSFHPSISADGRHVAYQSSATNLVPYDTNGYWDVFVHDRLTGGTARVSVGPWGRQGDFSSGSPSISADGRFIAFDSYAANLVPGDTNGQTDVFVHDRLTGTTTLVSVDSAGLQANYSSDSSSISADGGFVAFVSGASNLVHADTNENWDVFVHDLVTGSTTRVSVDSSGVEGDDASVDPSISSDGRFVAFKSWAANLVLNDRNRTTDIFAHDRVTGTTTCASVGLNGYHASDGTHSPSISAQGLFVAFNSPANNLVPEGQEYIEDVFVQGFRGPFDAVAE